MARVRDRSDHDRSRAEAEGSMSRYIQGRDGRFAGSESSGGTRVPTASDVPGRATAVKDTVGGGAPAPDRWIGPMYAAFLDRSGTEREERAWAADAPFPLTDAIWDENSVVLVDDHYEWVDFDRGGGRTRRGMVRRQTVQALLRAVEVASYRDPEHPTATITVYACPAFTADDGSRVGVHARREPASGSFAVGAVSPSGAFRPDTRVWSFFDDHVGEAGCPLSRHADLLIEDWTYGLRGDGTRGGVGGVYVKATTEDREVDPADLVDWEARDPRNRHR